VAFLRFVLSSRPTDSGPTLAQDNFRVYRAGARLEAGGQTGASWNQIGLWLQQMASLRAISAV
jgi:hypothetical protein